MQSRSLAALLLAGDLACGPPAPECPPATAVDPARAQAVLATARSTRPGHGLDGGATICFGGHDRGSVLASGAVVIADSLDRPAAAARLIHLRLHVADGLHRFPTPGVACEAQMEAARAAEARAITAEIEACDELGCAEPPYSFAAAVLAAAPEARIDLVLARLRDEPAADGLGLMLRNYRARCEAAR
ncbi:hypothetical protein [Nannocystis bainbridge]|uniref:Lipoprotein n=1 Tax=Nannocystis bainbridge TaxID=2995303 RepID=A0ABT5ECV7_9BACT|nr:hypothetical protein [Nannocystis bainbridge]MDC0723709.1 hypothetical protein [Nannocystis bainbridge]